MSTGRPDTLIVDAHVHTVDDALPRAEAVAIEGERISWIGSDDEALERAGPETQVIDAGGRLLLPGFVDSRNHVRLGSNPLEVDLTGATTLSELRSRVRAHADARSLVVHALREPRDRRLRVRRLSRSAGAGSPA